MSRSVVFALPSEAAGRRILRELASRFDARPHPARRFSTTFLDTFDWRLLRRGEALGVDRTPGGSLLCWRDREDRLRHRLPAVDPPEFAWDLPEGPLRDALAGRIEMRRLLPRVAVEGTVRVVDVVDRRHKTVARVRLERAAAAAASNGSRPRRIGAVLVVEGLRGYEKDAERIAGWIAREELPPAPATALGRALEVLELDVEAKPSRPELSPEISAGDALRRILAWLLAVMRHNEDGVIRNLDSEFLHDFRVAVRRTRSVLALFKRCFPDPERLRFRDEFAWLGSVTGPQRDLDVFLLDLPQMRAAIDDPAALDPLAAFLRRRHEAAAVRVADALRGERYERLVRDWTAFLAGAPPAEPERAARPVRDVAGRRIWRGWRRVRDDGRDIDAETPAESLHRLRIDCKKLRYLLEFFVNLYPSETMKPMIRSLKKLQDTLGLFNDLEVQQKSLARFAERMGEEGEVPQETLLAIGQLIEHLRREQEHERSRFAARFEQFDTSEHVAEARRLFRKGGA